MMKSFNLFNQLATNKKQKKPDNWDPSYYVTKYIADIYERLLLEESVESVTYVPKTSCLKIKHFDWQPAKTVKIWWVLELHMKEDCDCDCLLVWSEDGQTATKHKYQGISSIDFSEAKVPLRDTSRRSSAFRFILQDGMELD